MDKKRITGWSYYYTEPKHYWGCKKCKFIFGVITNFSDGSFDCRDVLESCNSLSDTDQEYIINTSTGHSDGNYNSSVTLESLFAHFIKDMQGWKY